MKLIEQLKEFFVSAKELERQGGPENAGELFEEILNKEKEILTSFGLPCLQRYNDILWELTHKNELNDKQLQTTITKLKKAAEEYLTSPTLTDIQLLEKAKNEHLDPYDVLPEINITTHDYTIFIYNQLLLTGIKSPKAVLEEYKRVTKYNCLGNIYIVGQSKNYKEHELYIKLKEYDLKFIDLYIKNQHESQSEETETAEITDENKAYKPNYLTITNMLVEQIVFDYEIPPTLMGKILLESNDSYNIQIGIGFSDLYHILITCGDLGLKISDLISQKLSSSYIESPTVIELKDIFGIDLIINNCYLEVYCPQHKDKNGNWVEDEGNLIMVDKIFNKQEFEKKVEQSKDKEQFNDCLELIGVAYIYYLRLKRFGLSEHEARKRSGLKNELLFKLSYLINKI